MTKRTINIYGARQNNLKNISLKIPKHKIVVFTGVSGSGKSSLVFETIGAEAQRQINETQDSFVRNRLQHFGVTDVDKIENLNVPVIINQKPLTGNIRSTVATITDIYANLRLLFSRMGEPFVGYSNVFSFNHPNGMCPQCEGIGIEQTIDIYKILDLDKSLNEEGAIDFPTYQPTAWRWTRYADSGYFDLDKKLKDYSEKEWDLFLYAIKATEQPPKEENIIPAMLVRNFLVKFQQPKICAPNPDVDGIVCTSKEAIALKSNIEWIDQVIDKEIRKDYADALTPPSEKQKQLNQTQAEGFNNWSQSVVYRFNGQFGQYVQISKVSSEYSGGAHGIATFEDYIFDLKSKKRIELKDIVINGKMNALKEELWKQYGYWCQEKDMQPYISKEGHRYFLINFAIVKYESLNKTYLMIFKKLYLFNSLVCLDK